MPSWCSNDITIIGTKEQLTKLKKKVSNTKKETKEDWNNAELDFNKAFPCPTILTKIHSGNVHINGKSYRNWIELDSNANFTGFLTRGEFTLQVGLEDFQVEALVEEFGASCSYDWECANYEVKWGGQSFFGVEDDFDLLEKDTYKWEVYGDTAWGVAEGLWQKICNDFGVSMKIHFGGEVEAGIYICVPETHKTKTSGYVEVDISDLSVGATSQPYTESDL